MKTITLFDLISLFIGLTIGNFVCDSLTTKDYNKTIDHSIFQLAALVGVWLVSSQKPNR